MTNTSAEVVGRVDAAGAADVLRLSRLAAAGESSTVGSSSSSMLISSSKHRTLFGGARRHEAPWPQLEVGSLHLNAGAITVVYGALSFGPRLAELGAMQALLPTSLLSVLLLSTSCATDIGEQPNCQDDRCDEQADADYIAAGEFRFCLSPGSATDQQRESIDDAFVDMPLPNLESIQFLAHMADVAYWEPEDIGPELERLGFGKPGDGKWQGNCAIDAKMVRDSELENPLEDPYLSSCAKDWVAVGGTDPQGFISYVFGEAHPNRDIEFFSAGYQTKVDGVFEQGSTQMFWAKHRTEPWIIVAFRGTADGGDAWVDLNYPTKPFLGEGLGWGAVHGGFYDAYLSVADLLDEKLTVTTNPDAPRIWITGHSLGGALASVATVELLARSSLGWTTNLGGMATFGSPRVGDTTFYERAESIAIERGVALHRVRNTSNSITGYDPIVHVPFQSTFGEEFKHVGAPLGLYENGSITYALLQERGILDFIGEAIAAVKERAFDILSSAFPHALGHYHERLGKAIRKGGYADLRKCDPR